MFCLAFFFRSASVHTFCKFKLCLLTSIGTKARKEIDSDSQWFSFETSAAWSFLSDSLDSHLLFPRWKFVPDCGTFSFAQSESRRRSEPALLSCSVWLLLLFTHTLLSEHKPDIAHILLCLWKPADAWKSSAVVFQESRTKQLRNQVVLSSESLLEAAASLWIEFFLLLSCFCLPAHYYLPYRFITPSHYFLSKQIYRLPPAVDTLKASKGSSYLDGSDCYWSIVSTGHDGFVDMLTFSMASW